MNERIYGVLLNYANAIFSVLINFMYVPILLSFIGKNEYGIYQLIGALVGYITVLERSISPGVTQYYTKFKALDNKKQMENILATAFRIYGVVIAIIVLIAIIGYQFLGILFKSVMTNNEILLVKQMFILLVINLVITVFSSPINSAIMSFQRFRFLKLLSFVTLILQPIFSILILYKFPTSLVIVVVQTVLNIIFCGCRWYYALNILKVKIHYYEWKWSVMRPFTSLILSIFGVVIIEQIFFRTNQLILGILKGPEVVAVYAIASTIYLQYMSLAIMISSVFEPRIVEMISKNKSLEEISELFIKIGRWQWFVLAYILTGFIIFGKFFIYWWVGDSFSDAYYITLLLIIPFSVELLLNIGNTVIQAYDKFGYRAKVSWIVGILCLLFAIPATKFYGAFGSAACTGISWFIISGLIMNRYYSVVIGLNMKAFWSQLGHVTIYLSILFIFAFLCFSLIPVSSLKSLIVGGILYTVVYCLVLFMFCMNKNEKRLLSSLWNKICYIK